MYDFPTRRKTSITHHKQMLVHKNYKIENKYVCVYVHAYKCKITYKHTIMPACAHVYAPTKPKQWTMILAKAAALMAKGGEQGVGRC